MKTNFFRKTINSYELITQFFDWTERNEIYLKKPVINNKSADK